MLDGIVRIGFEEQIYCDVKFSITNELYDPVNDEPKTIRYACYQPKITINRKTYHYGQEIYGLYLKDTKFPMNKTLSNGILYKSPMKLI